MDNRNKTTELHDKVAQLKSELPEGSIDDIVETKEEVQTIADVPETAVVEEETVNDTDYAEQPDEQEAVTEEPDQDDIEDVSTQDLPPLEERYKESSREAQTLYYKNRKMTDAIIEASSMPEPTEDELRAYAEQRKIDFDDLDSLGLTLFKDSYKNEVRFKRIEEASAVTRELDGWVANVEEFVENENNLNKYPSLQNNSEEFKAFAAKPHRKGMDFDDLVGLFMFKKSQQKEAQPKKKSMLLDKGNGRNTPPKRKGFNEDDLRHIRKTQGEKAYKKALKDNNISINI